MQFNSIYFLIFFPLVTLIYFLLPHRYRWIHLLTSSCIFYCAFIPSYIFILFFTITIDYFSALLITKSKGLPKKALLILSLFCNISVLLIFKYFNFFTTIVSSIFHALHIAITPLPFLDIILPIGLSFHTFQAMSYTIEVYRENQKPEKHFGIFALYIMFFPQLVAGPIERPQNLLHQFYEEHDPDYAAILSGLRQMLWGFFKKIVIADRLAQFVNPVFSSPTDYNGINLAIALLFFAYQIYFDFSGYSDIALGSARILGFRLMRNFNHPFQSKSVTEFWRRWHISLSTWFNDYLFTPFIIQRRSWGKLGIILGLLSTFLISGLWHGAGWTFVFFGLIHGLAMIYEFMTKGIRTKLAKIIPDIIYIPICRIITFLFLIFSWLFFRSPDLTFAKLYWLKMTSYNQFSFSLIPVVGFTKLSFIAAGCCCFFALIFERFIDPELHELNDKPVKDFFFFVTTLLLIVCLGIFSHQSFIYFQF